VLALATIIARERRDISGVQPGREAVALGYEQLETVPAQHVLDPEHRPVAAAVLTDALRAAQELAELLDALGMYVHAWHALRHIPRLYASGDPEIDTEPSGWEQQYNLTRASLSRHLAAVTGRWRRWLPITEQAADRSFDLATSGWLPVAYSVAASNQRVAHVLARVGLLDKSNNGAKERLLRIARERLRESTALADLVGSEDDRSTRGARLGVARRSWELALLTGDREEVQEARAEVVRLLGPWTLRLDLEKLDRLDRASRAIGVDDDPLRSPTADRDRLHLIRD
jgi:hypothetical protein